MKPLLYTFRRCPFAIRARLAITVSGVEVDQHEVSLRAKPKEMLECSPKGTVPVLRFADGSVLEQSLDIMRWALSIHDPEHWLDDDQAVTAEIAALIKQNDETFKPALDLYKYAVRFPQHSEAYYREQAEPFLAELDIRLSKDGYLICGRYTLADMAVFPFIRQFSNVNRDWFYASRYHHLIAWLDRLIGSELFQNVMQKEAESLKEDVLENKN
ncbi:glutathione S-transferase [Nitrosomonas oligotropha]|uniref:Glutathione S-transferase n=1 Tax=Nitrosomonas oligotropha TaxID=42354 RepID=A0A1H8S0X1_9PROT|nr:glutathione S-transferase [Nitrosomonas oligotropha]SDX00689.1 Glutathione S-transferase [Nitrosomonas oligotropha]SEO72589.1 Glutathione S-transferase [Nitrosomonas oligotropha]